MLIDPCLFLDEMSRTYRRVLDEIEGVHGTPTHAERHGLSLLLRFSDPTADGKDVEIIVEIEPDATASSLNIQAVKSIPGEDCCQLYVRHVDITIRPYLPVSTIT